MKKFVFRFPTKEETRKKGKALLIDAYRMWAHYDVKEGERGFYNKDIEYMWITASYMHEAARYLGFLNVRNMLNYVRTYGMNTL